MLMDWTDETPETKRVAREAMLRERAEIERQTGLQIQDDGRLVFPGRVIHMPIPASALPIEERAQLQDTLDGLIEAGYTPTDIRRGLRLIEAANAGDMK